MTVKVASALTATVVLAHLLILQGTSNALQATAPNASRPFTTRSITLASAQPPAQSALPLPSNVAPKTAKVQAKPKTASSPQKTPPKINTDATTIGPVAVAPPEGPAGRVGAPVEPPPVGFGNVASEPPAMPTATPTAVPPSVSAAPAPAPAPATVTAAATATATAVAAASAASNPASPPASPSLPAPPANVAYTVPGSTRLKYNVIATKDSLSFSARGELLWLQDGNTYDARLEISAFLLGARVQTSTGRLTAAGLEPKRFSDKFRSEVAAHFERDKGVVTFSANTPQVPLVAGMQDQLSAVMQLSAMIAAAPAQYPPGTAIQFDTVGPRSSEQWVLTVGEEEKLSLPGGELQALKLYRKPRGEYDQTLEVWLAPRLNYLPARIKLTEKNGDYADQVWRATEAP